MTDNEGAVGTASRQITVQPPTGSVNVTVTDNNGQPIPGVRAVATVAGDSRSGTTGADGKVLLADVIAGGGTLALSRDTFVSKEVPIVVPVNETVNYEVALVRVTRATGGVLTTAVIPGTLSADGKTVEFSVQVVVVDQDSNAIGGLTAAAFNLPGCTPNPVTSGPECVAASVGSDSSLDVPYTVLGPGTTPPPSFAEIPGGLPQPYAAALAFDQSISISTNDPTDARLFSAEEFLKGLGPDDRVALSAFADDGATAGNEALIPEPPVTIFPVGAPSFFQQSNVSDLFPTLDALSVLEGGATPLYEAICRVIDFSSANAPAGPRKAVVVFTDGRNQPGINLGSYVCNTIDGAVARSKAQGVDIFTIGLSGNVDGLALGTLAAEGNGVFLFAEDVSQLITIYGSLGNLLSRSLTTYKLTYRIGTDVAGTFQVNRRIRGTLGVNTGTTTVNLPFVVRIFGP